MRNYRVKLFIMLFLLTAVSCDDDDKTTPDLYESSYTMPVLQDWTCPDGWGTAPIFVDEDGNENVPEGMVQSNRCTPPESWNNPSGPAELESWTCPDGWVSVEHATLNDSTGNSFSYCEPPKIALIYSANDTADGSDYISPIPEGDDISEYTQCDVDLGLMPDLKGT